MSPEQVHGAATDERTDFYALGVILYQMLANRKPYQGSTREEILVQHVSAPSPALPPQLSTYQPLIDRLMAKSASQRVANARALVELVDDFSVPELEQSTAASR
jgi:serine/threonine protein kinase